jgi:hypothetical protein
MVTFVPDAPYFDLSYFETSMTHNHFASFFIHAAFSCRISVRHVHAAWAAYPRGLSMLHVCVAYPASVSMLLFRASVHAACPCCFSMLYVVAACPCCLSSLHVLAACSSCVFKLHVHAVCIFCMHPLHFYSYQCCLSMHSMLRFHEACPCGMSLQPALACPFRMLLLHFHASCICFICMLHVFEMESKTYEAK